jgi:hypothetical protein
VVHAIPFLRVQKSIFYVYESKFFVLSPGKTPFAVQMIMMIKFSVRPECDFHEYSLKLSVRAVIAPQNKIYLSNV